MNTVLLLQSHTLRQASVSSFGQEASLGWRLTMQLLTLTLPDSSCVSLPLQELQTLVLGLRDDMVSLRTSADHMEEKLKAEILFLKEQIQAEQCLKENLEDTLQLEIEGCKEEIGQSSVLNWSVLNQSLLW